MALSKWSKLCAQSNAGLDASDCAARTPVVSAEGKFPAGQDRVCTSCLLLAIQAISDFCLFQEELKYKTSIAK